MAKPMLVTLPAVLLLLDYWPLARWQTNDGAVPYRRRATRLLIEKLPLIAIAAASSAVTLIVQKIGGSVVSLERIPLPARIENAPVAYVTYIAKMLYPADLAVFYPHPGALIPLGKVIAATVLLLAVTITVLGLARRTPYLPVGWLWYLGTLVPVIGIIQIGDQAFADRYTYLPLIGLFAAVGWGAADVFRRIPYGRWLFAISGMAAVAAMAAATTQQLPHWRDTIALFDHAARVTSNNRLAHYNLGCTFLNQKRYAEAADHFYAALQVDPNHVESITNLGMTLMGMGKTDTAISLFYTALSIRPNHVNAQINLAVALMEKNEIDQAVTWLSDALALSPDSPDAHFNLGLARYKQAKYDEAEAHLTEALRLRPRDVDATYTLALAHLQQKRYDDAARTFARVLELKPDHAQARQELDRLRATPESAAR
jgi:tetratricopeptide (TPR) repeat protein